MGLAIVVAVCDVILHVAGRPSLVDGLLYALAVALVVLLRTRSVTAAFVAALALASFTGGAFLLLPWIAYQAGRAIVTRLGWVIAAGAAVGALTGQLATQPGSIARVLTTFLIFIVLPTLAGRYVAQHERLVSTLEQNSRLRIARDMHDSIGHRLSLVSIQAAALEVSDLPPQHRAAVADLAVSVRAAMDELYAMVATLRGSAPAPAPPRIDAIAQLATDFATSGIPIILRHSGKPHPVAPEAAEAAYRVAQEGLTNAAKHAPGRPIAINLSWEPDTLLLTLTNPALTPDAPAPAPDASAHTPGLATPAHTPGLATPALAVGHGLTGLDERVRQAGGFLDHRIADGEFRLTAMLPYARTQPTRTRIVAIGIAVAALMFVLLPATMVVGVSP